MAESKKSKTVKKVTEIPSASVKIEVEEKEDKEISPSEIVEETKEEELSVPKETSEETGQESSGGLSWKKIILIIAIVVPIGFLMFGGFLYFSKDFNFGSFNKESEKTLNIPEVSPTPTIESVDKEAYEIELLNGSGISGEGARVKEILEEEGFRVGTPGNADNSNYTKTVIVVNDEVPQGYIDELTKVLEERGTVDEVENFATGEDGEVRVILGSDVTEEETAPSPTPELE